jgi:hypothetical protein
MAKKEVIKKTVKKEIIKSKPKPVKHAKKTEKPKAKAKIKKVMKEFKEHKLHSGSKKGPEVTNPKQAIAIALSEARRGKKKKRSSK